MKQLAPTIGFIACLALLSLTAFSQEAQNPLSIVADYNTKADGSFASGDIKTAPGGYFKWAQVAGIKLPKGYHVPTKEELMAIAGRYDFDSNPPHPDFTWKINRGIDEEVTLFGKTMTLYSHYYGEGKDICYGLRFKGGDNKYLSAYKWEPALTGKISEEGFRELSHIKVTCRLLGPSGKKITVQEICKPEFWANNNHEDVVKYFPTAGYGNYTEDGTIMDVNVKGRYWSSTPRNKTGAFGFGFDENMVMVGNWVNTALYSVRLFKDSEEEESVLTDAAITLTTTAGSKLVFVVEGPKKIWIDLGDGKRKEIDLLQSGSSINETSLGTDIALYADDITRFSANNNKITALKVHKGKKISKLEVAFNQLSNLSLEGMPALKHLNLASNKLTELTPALCPKLTYLAVSKNFYIKALDLSGNPLLEELYVAINDLEKLDLEKLTSLQMLDISKNKGLKTINLSKAKGLLQFTAEGSSLTAIDFTANEKLESISLRKSKVLSTIKYSGIRGLLRCFVSECAFDGSALKDLMKALPDVSNIKVWPTERSWKRQLEYANNPGSAQIDAQLSKRKGWFSDVLEECWSLSPKAPCLVLTTAINAGEEISFEVCNFYDPFWINWGNMWGSFWQQKPYTVKRAIIEKDIKYYSRGLMTIKCNDMKLAACDLTGNNQTYAIDLKKNELTTLTLDKANVLVALDLRDNKLSERAINKLFEALNTLAEIENPFALPDEIGYQGDIKYGIIYLHGNPGSNSCDPKIAQKKGYTVDLTTSNTPLPFSNQADELCMAPNPAQDYTVISKVEAGELIRVFALDGSLFFEVHAGIGDEERLDLSNLNDGVYLLTHKNSKAKLIIQR